METVYVILWTVIFINIASIVFNMVSMSRESDLAKKRFIQGIDLGRLATLAAMMDVIGKRDEIKNVVIKEPDFFKEIADKSEEDIKESISRIYKK